MNEHPISTIMGTSMKNIKEMIDVNTIVGDAIRTDNGGVIIPVSKVSFGFATGGGEYGAAALQDGKPNDKQFPFAGGSGAGVSITPMAFMVMQGEDFRLVPATPNTSVDRILEMVPGLMKKTEDIICRVADKCADRKNKKQQEHSAALVNMDTEKPYC